MQESNYPVRRGHVLLSRALVERGHNLTDAETATGSGQGTIGRVLSLDRGVGMDLAAKIAKAYPDVPVGSWAEEPEDGEVVVPVPRGKARVAPVAP